MKNIISTIIIGVLLATAVTIWSEDTETASIFEQASKQESSSAQRIRQIEAEIKNAMSYPNFIPINERGNITLKIKEVAEHIAAREEYDSFLKSFPTNASVHNGEVVVSWEYDGKIYRANANGVTQSTVDEGLKTSNTNNEPKNGPVVITSS